MNETIKTTDERNKEIVTTILRQIGGQMMMMMTGGKASREGQTLTIKLPRNKGFKITLNGSDLYDVVFFKWNRKTLAVTTTASFDDVYAEMLVEMIEKNTGLYIRM